MDFTGIFEAVKLPALIWIGAFALLLMIPVSENAGYYQYLKYASDIFEWLVPGWLGYRAVKHLKLQDSDVRISGAALGIAQMAFIILASLVLTAIGFESGIAPAFISVFSQADMGSFIVALTFVVVVLFRIIRCVIAAQIGATAARRLK